MSNLGHGTALLRSQELSLHLIITRMPRFSPAYPVIGPNVDIHAVASKVLAGETSHRRDKPPLTTDMTPGVATHEA